MDPTIKCGRHLAEHADLSGSRLHDVNLSGAEFDDVNMSKNGMTIDGIPVADMMAAYKKRKK